jgi:AraC family transcriptional activator of pobA
VAKQSLPVYNTCNLSEQPQQNQPLLVDRFSHYLTTHQHLVFPHKHTFYHLVYFTKGSGYHFIDFVKFPVAAGQIYFMIPGQVHTWQFEGEVDGYIINFSDNFFGEFLNNPRYIEQFSFFSGNALEQVMDVSDFDRPRLVQFFEDILKEDKSKLAKNDDMIRAIILQLFLHLGRYQSTLENSQQRTGNTLMLHQFKKLIDIHFKEKKLPKEYAAMLYVTPNHLNALTKDVAGKPAGELIRDRILLEVKRLLVNAQLTIAEIAAELNFEDNSYFSRFFKKYEGVSPEDFRKQFNNKK